MIDILKTTRQYLLYTWDTLINKKWSSTRNYKKLFDSGSQDHDESNRSDSLDNTDPPYGQYKLILLFTKPFIVS